MFLFFNKHAYIKSLPLVIILKFTKPNHLSCDYLLFQMVTEHNKTFVFFIVSFL